MEPNFHKHKCHFCGYVWKHHDINDVRHGSGGAHECPSCDRCNWSLGIYDGKDEPQTTNGVTPEMLPAVFGDSDIHPDQNHYHGD